MEAEDRKEKKEKEQEGRNQGSEDESNHAGKGNRFYGVTARSNPALTIHGVIIVASTGIDEMEKLKVGRIPELETVQMDLHVRSVNSSFYYNKSIGDIN